MKKSLVLIASLAMATGFYTQAKSVFASTADTPTSLTADNPDESDVTDVTIDQYLENISGIEEVTGQKLLSLVQSKDTYILYIGYKECPYCREFSKTLKQFKSESSIPLYYINLDDNYPDITAEDFNQIGNFIQTKIQLSGTPTIAKIVDGDAKTVLVGSDTTLGQLTDLLTL